jgi:ubiquinone/menaquinone biosynthesis C-methylase UbiE
LRQFSLLDVGTGSGDMRPPDGFSVGLDRQIRHLRLGGGVRVCGEALALPFAERSFDFAAANLLLHHFEAADAVALLEGMARVARHAVLINDLERHPVAYHFARWAPFSRVTRHDAPLSVARAFHREEMEDLARRAGFSRFRVRRHVPFRLSLVAELS